MAEVFEMAVVFSAIVLITKIVGDTMTRHRLINKGLVDKNVKYLYTGYAKNYLLSNIKWGLVLVGIGLALLIKQFAPLYIHDESMLGLMFLFAGIAFLIYYFIAKDRLSNNNEETSSP